MSFNINKRNFLLASVDCYHEFKALKLKGKTSSRCGGSLQERTTPCRHSRKVRACASSPRKTLHITQPPIPSRPPAHVSGKRKQRTRPAEKAAPTSGKKRVSPSGTRLVQDRAPDEASPGDDTGDVPGVDKPGRVMVNSEEDLRSSAAQLDRDRVEMRPQLPVTRTTRSFHESRAGLANSFLVLANSAVLPASLIIYPPQEPSRLALTL